MTIAITITLSAISALAGLALTLQSASAQQRGVMNIEWPEPLFVCASQLENVRSTLGLASWICL